MRKESELLRSILASAALLAILTISACSQSTPDATDSTDSAIHTSTTPEASFAIHSPKNLKDVGDPCQLLTPQQLSKLGAQATPERVESIKNVPACDWDTDDFAVTITADTATGGIDNKYASKENFNNFAPVKVKGYPAAHINETKIQCRVTVGVSKASLFTVDFTNHQSGNRSDLKDPCAFAEKVAAEALSNIPDAQ